MGRLTLNPIAHMDPLGSLILVLTYFGGSFLFGWAKPVPVDPRNLRTSPQVGMALVGAAGPATNFVLALVAGAVYAHTKLTGDALTIVGYAITVNVILGVFNLFPIPPLDGSRIIGGFMPRDVYQQLGRARPVRHVRRLRRSSSSSTTRPRACSRAASRTCCAVISAIVGGHPLI